jgi:hypothetical protein
VIGVLLDGLDHAAVRHQVLPGAAEADVGLAEGVGILGLVGGFGVGQRLVDLGSHGRIGRQFGDASHGGRLEQEAHLVDVVHVLKGECRDDEAAPVGGEQALAGEPGQGFAHRRARDTEFFRQLDFLQRLAGADGAVAQMPAQRLIYLVAEGERTLERLDDGYHG